MDTTEDPEAIDEGAESDSPSTVRGNSLEGDPSSEVTMDVEAVGPRGRPPLRLLALIALVLALIVGVAATVVLRSSSPAQAGPVMLRYDLAPNTSFAYTMTVTENGVVTPDQGNGAQTIALTMSLPFTLHVTSRSPDGSEWVHCTYGGEKITVNGHTTSVPLSGVSVDEHLSRDGTTLQATTHGFPKNTTLNASQMSINMPQFPLTAVKVGQHWSTKTKVSVGSYVSGDTSMDATLTGLTNDGTRQVATIEGAGSGNMAVSTNGESFNGTMKATSTASVYADTGELLSTHASITIDGRVTTSRGSGSLHMTEELSLSKG